SLSQKLTGNEQGLIGYWNFEETSGHIVNDLTTNSNHGMLINGVQRTIENTTQVKYQSSNALYFDGINDSVKVSHSSSLDLVNQWTLEAWIFRNTTGRIDPIIEKYNWQAGFGGFTLRVTDTNKLIASVINGVNANVVESNTTINSQQWYHVSATFDGSQKTLKLYVNGVLVGVNSDVTITPISSNVSLKIGERGDDLQPRYWYFNGQIDDVRVWKVARTQAEIQANLSQKLSGNEQGLAGYWNFEEATGNTVNDLTTNKNNGTLINGVQRTVANSNPITRPEGKTLYFDGVNDYINAGTNPSLELSTNLTLEAWINPQQDSRHRGIVGREGEYLLALSGADNIIYYAVANSNPGWNWISTGYGVKSNEWSHVAFSYENGRIKTYVNGQLIYTYDGVGTIVDAAPTNLDELRIGNRQWNNVDSFKGEIDEVRVWNVTRTQAEIEANLSQKLSGKERGLVGYWNFEETSGHIVNDLTTNSNHGMLINGVQRTVANSNPIARPEGKALYFDGVNDYIQVGANASLIVSDKFTLEAWIKPINQGGVEGGIIINKEGEYEIARFSDGTIRWGLAGINWGSDWFNTGYVAPDNQWTHITLSYDKNAVKLYANGQLVHSYDASVTIGDYWTNLNEFRIGGRQANNPQYFKGEIDEVRVWNVARTQAEIQANLSQRLTGKEQGLVGYWNFEESPGNTVYDLTVNDNDGTLINGTQRTIDSSVSIPLVTAQQIQVTEDKAISDLQKLRLETAYLTLQAEKDPDKLQKYLQTYNSLKILGTTDNQGTDLSLFDIVTPLGSVYQDALRSDPGAWIIRGDYNGDGKTDFIRQEHGAWDDDPMATFSVYFSKGDGYFDVVIPLDSKYQDALRGDNGAFIIPGDYNGDGKTDFIRQEHGSWGSDTVGTFSIYFSKGDGNFDVFTPLGSQYQDALRATPGAWMIPGDYNGDGKTDFIRQEHSGWGSDTVGTFSIYFSKGDGYFDIVTPQGGVYQDWLRFGYGSYITPGDFNGDGKTDFIRQDQGGWDDDLINSVNIYFSKGDGYFDIVTPQGGVYQDWLRFDPGSNIISGDFNGDGYDDFVRQDKGGWDDDLINSFNIYFSNPAKQQALKLLGANDGVKNITLNSLRTQYYPELNQADTLANLQQQITKEIGDSEKQIADLQSEITRKNSESAAALSQATWYEEQAATHWQLSRKAGPTWTEQRSYTERTWYGKKKTKWITVTHVDHNWIIWDTYSKQAVSLREHSANLLKGVATDTTNQNTASEILKQWQAANAVADETSLTQAQLTTLLNQLDAQFKLNADKKQQIADWEKLLPTLQSQLDQAIKNAKTAQGNVSKEWTEYQTSQKTYQTALADVFPRRVELNIQGQQLLQEINAVQTWVNQQNTLLTEEITQVETLITQLKTQQNNIPTNLPENQSLTLKTLIDQSSNLLTQKQIVLSAQQATFLQKQTLLNTQKKVIETQYQLLDAYLESPDNDTSNLEKLLTDTQKTL
ncbi:MAG: hypothetical protein PX635_02435, partial [Nostocales cyanobacterium LE14-WE12]|nr:hypothetical protein [Nostocales cyanobacterium LE14-WE12]